MAAKVIYLPIRPDWPENPRVCTECVMGEMHGGELVCLLAGDTVTDVVAEAASCEEFESWLGG